MVGTSSMDASERGSRAVRVAPGIHLFLGVAFGASSACRSARRWHWRGGRERPSTDCRGSRRIDRDS